MTKLVLPNFDSPINDPVRQLFAQIPPVPEQAIPIPSVYQVCRENIIRCRSIISQLRELIEQHTFETEGSEIKFFKEIKPAFSAQLLFWSKLFQMHLKLPIGGKTTRITYWSNCLAAFSTFFKEHRTFYEYVRSGETFFDSLYFVRRFVDEQMDVSLDLNVRFSTARDRLLAEMLSLDMLSQFITNYELGEEQPAGDMPLSARPLRWTASKTGLVELIYALQTTGVYNQGTAEIKEIAALFEGLFQVDLGNYYGVFNELRLRKKNRTAFLDQMKQKVEQKMDALDDK